MARVTWTESAHADLREIRTYIGRHSQANAAQTLRQIVRSVNQLQQFPASGRAIPEFQRSTFREVLVGSYRVLYEYIPDDDLVRVLAVIHGSRRLEDLDLP